MNSGLLRKLIIIIIHLVHCFLLRHLAYYYEGKGDYLSVLQVFFLLAKVYF